MHLALWHGLNLAALYECIATGLGAVLYLRKEPILPPLHRMSSVRWNMNSIYDGLLHFGLRIGSNRVTGRMMTGYLRDYMVLILGFAVLNHRIRSWYARASCASQLGRLART